MTNAELIDDKKARARERARLWRIAHPNAMKEWRERNADHVRAYRKERYPEIREAALAYRFDYYRAHRQEILAKVKAKYVPSTRILKTQEQKTLKNRRRATAWAKKYPERINARNRAWAHAHLEMVAAMASARRALKLNATPPWSDRKAIFEIYLKAKEISKLTGTPHHVDHVYPLVGEGFNGLHVSWNLQVLPWRENLRKSNKRPA